jgi:ribosomal protein S3
LLKRVKLSKSNIISGLKVECSGKWKQTASGRKQKLLFVVGNIKAQSVDQVISYGFSTINTKFGSCSFKVWVCFKPLKGQ